MRGHPGCGKSSLASALSTRYHIPLVDKDDAKDGLQKLSNIVDNTVINDISYDIMVNITWKQLSNGISVIVDSPLSRKTIYERLCCIATKVGATLIVLECISSDLSLWNNRLVQRKSNVHGLYHKPSDLQEVLNLIHSYGGEDAWKDDELAHHILLDTTIIQSLEDQIKCIDDYLKKNELYSV
jgi:predicted kinase